MSDKKFCGPSVKKIPDGDDRERLICPDCGFIDYRNPRIVVGAVCTWENKFLLCRRAIEPSVGKWTFPAGFMELNESVAQAAAREAREEAGVDVDIEDIIGIYEVPAVGHVMIMHRARMRSGNFSAGFESQEVALFDWADIPWDELAFPSVAWTLQRFHEVRDQQIVPAVYETSPYIHIE